MNRFVRVLLLVCAALLLAAPLAAQARPFPGPDVQQIYARLLPQIEKIPMFDHHAHPGFPDDPDVDAQAAPPAYTEPLRVRADNPEMVQAAKAMFGYPYNDFTPDHAKWLVAKKAELSKAKGKEYFSWVLDQIGIERCIANRAMMADYLDQKRYPWVFFADSFLFPFNNERVTGKNPDRGVYIPLQEKMLHRWMAQVSQDKLPATFDAYLAFVTLVLEDNQRRGGIAMKFEVAYFRPTTFGDPSKEAAEDVYKRFVGGGVPSDRDYLTFQDYVFRYLIREGGRLQLPVHIHTALGIGNYFNLLESNVLNLEPILRDPRYGSTKFVLIHGGYPYEHQAILFGAANNVYLETSFQELVMYPSEFKHVLKQWLETLPEKVTFGTDAFPYNDVLGAEESLWLGAQSTRMALAAALAEMISEGEVTEARALEMAHAYLHDTAAGLYDKKPAAAK